MVYSNKFVLCVLVDGQVQKELHNGEVQIPFNTPYVLRFRNKNNRRAVVKFTIDGENVSGNGYIIPANTYIDIQRHEHRDAAFVLVPLDSPEAVDAGKNGPNTDKSKGVVVASFFLEQEITRPIYRVPRDPMRRYPTFPGKEFPLAPPYQPTLRCQASGQGVAPDMTGVSQASVFGSKSVEEGCTVEGHATGQMFQQTYINTESDSVDLRIVLTGFHRENDRRQTHIVEAQPQSSFDPNADLKKQIADLEREELQQRLQELKDKKFNRHGVTAGRLPNYDVKSLTQVVEKYGDFIMKQNGVLSFGVGLLADGSTALRIAVAKSDNDLCNLITAELPQGTPIHWEIGTSFEAIPYV